MTKRESKIDQPTDARRVDLMKRHHFSVLGIVAFFALCVFPVTGEKVLYEKDSRYVHIRVTEDDQDFRSLMFSKDGDLQSVVKLGDPDHLELPYTPVMMTGLVFVEKPQRVLMVGLGGGSIPCFLHHRYPDLKIDVVDIDPDIVAVAKRFFGFREDQRMKAFVDDGRKFIEKCKTPYDIIFLDAYGKDDLPLSLATREFFQAVRRALKPNGVVVGNVFSRYSNPHYDAMIRTYQDVFEELYIFDVRERGNRIFVGLPFKLCVPRAKLVGRARTVSKKGGFRFDLGEIVEYGYQYATDRHVPDPILTDREHVPGKEVKTP